jgi:hypothetical protein
MRSALALLCLALALAGCGGAYDDGARSQAGIASITVSLSSAAALASAGETRLVTAEARDAYGAVVAAPALSWSSSAEGVATVSEAGTSATITAVGDGVASITAASPTAHGTVTVAVHRLVASVVVAGPPALAYGASTQLTVTARDALGNAIEDATSFVFSSSDPGTVAVSDTGLATALFDLGGPQAAVVTATLTREGVTAAGATEIATGPPDAFDSAALMLSEFERPTAVPTLGEGAAFFFVVGERVDYTLTWAQLSGPATGASINGLATASQIAAPLVELPLGAQASSFGTLTGSFTAADIRLEGGSPVMTLDALLEAMNGSEAYVEVRTADFPSGEIRGQVVGNLALGASRPALRTARAADPRGF